MILAFLLIQSAVVGPGDLPKQALPASGCAAYLWSTGDRRFVAMAGADPAQLRIAIDGRVVDLPRQSESGAGDYGFAGSTRYAATDIVATLDMTVVRRADLSAGATVPGGTLTITAAGRDIVVVPVAGLIGCA